jgi:hypothetical protein
LHDFSGERKRGNAPTAFSAGSPGTSVDSAIYVNLNGDQAANREHARRLAKADELTGLAEQASSPGSRVAFLQLAAAFRRLADMLAPKPPNDAGR